MNINKLYCYDICCGGGIFSLGFNNAGFNIIGGIDKDQYAINTAQKNIPNGQWEKLSLEDLSNLIENDNPHPILKASIILAGLPCQGFSTAGKRNPNDHRNSLYKYLINIVEKIKPKYIVIENVGGLIHKDNRVIFNDIIKHLTCLGYDVNYRLYDAVNFGVPQYRKRVFIIASLDIPVRFIFENIRFSNKINTVKDAFKYLSSTKKNIYMNHTFMVHSNKVINKIKGIKDAKIISYRRLPWDKPSLTIISGHNALPVHPKRHRSISNREAARIQGIPDNFIFEGPRSEQTVQVANAVPYPMAYTIAQAIKNSNKAMVLNQGNLYKNITTINKNNKLQEYLKHFVNYYKDFGKRYPWRRTSDPYIILLTEILLQRTKGEMVNKIWKEIINSIEKSYNGYHINKSILNGTIKRLGILNRVETIESLNTYLHLHFNDKIPEYFEQLMHLPGVGIYMASAVRTFAYKASDFPVDSNAFRFIHRYYGVKIKGNKLEGRQIRDFMNSILNGSGSKEFVYGFLDFSSTICTPRKPKCDQCFLNKNCTYFQNI